MYADLHNHLLHGIDDGAKSPEESLAIGRALVTLGFDTVAPSPHAQPRYPGAAAVAARRAEVQALFDAQGVALKLLAGAENVFDEHFLPAMADATTRRTINGGRYVLVETPYLGSIPGFPDLCYRLRLKGITPVVAHPERCAQFETKGQAEAAAQVGCVLQLDIGALTGRYGRTAKRLSEQFLDAGLYGIGATDVHSEVGALDWVGKSLQLLEKAVGKKGLNRLMDRNPRAILAGEEVEPS